ncbi:MAG: XRE family transcriptional regulator [Sphingomonadales bacterium]|nr:XRE family transcriptional regulator [Sphingomonadales bacterium]
MQANGDMLRLARHRRGFQQTEAAKRLGIDQSMLSRIENGMVEVRNDLLVRAAIVYGFPQTFFYQRDPIYGAPVSVHPMWRKKTDVSVREVDSVVAEINLRIMHLRRFLEGVEIGFTGNLPRLDIDDYGSPEKVAGVVRSHWGLPRGPIKDLTLHVEKSGVIVVYSPMDGASISGVTFSTPGMPSLIILNSEQPADRLRFTLAHELGHLVMHRFPNPKMEEEANAFASELLLPSSDIKPYFVGRKIDLALLAALKPEWRVSMGALLMAADKHGRLLPNQKQYLWKQMSARGYRLREPPELDFLREEPTILRNLLEVHRGALGYSITELAALLHLGETDLTALYQVNDNAPQRPRLTIVK